jgi:hypothetical protein
MPNSPVPVHRAPNSDAACSCERAESDSGVHAISAEAGNAGLPRGRNTASDRQKKLIREAIGKLRKVQDIEAEFWKDRHIDADPYGDGAGIGQVIERLEYISALL